MCGVDRIILPSSVEDTVACVSLNEQPRLVHGAASSSSNDALLLFKTLAVARPFVQPPQCVELVMSGRHEKETADLLTSQV